MHEARCPAGVAPPPRGNQPDDRRKQREDTFEKTFRRRPQQPGLSPRRQADSQKILHLFEKTRLWNVARLNKHKHIIAGGGQRTG